MLLTVGAFGEKGATLRPEFTVFVQWIASDNTE
jgi:hypothetical protein